MYDICLYTRMHILNLIVDDTSWSLVELNAHLGDGVFPFGKCITKSCIFFCDWLDTKFLKNQIAEINFNILIHIKLSEIDKSSFDRI